MSASASFFHEYEKLSNELALMSKSQKSDKVIIAKTEKELQLVFTKAKSSKLENTITNHIYDQLKKEDINDRYRRFELPSEPALSHCL